MFDKNILYESRNGRDYLIILKNKNNDSFTYLKNAIITHDTATMESKLKYNTTDKQEEAAKLTKDKAEQSVSKLSDFLNKYADLQIVKVKND